MVSAWLLYDEVTDWMVLAKPLVFHGSYILYS